MEGSDAPSPATYGSPSLRKPTARCRRGVAERHQLPISRGRQGEGSPLSESLGAIRALYCRAEGVSSGSRSVAGPVLTIVEQWATLSRRRQLKPTRELADGDAKEGLGLQIYARCERRKPNCVNGRAVAGAGEGGGGRATQATCEDGGPRYLKPETSTGRWWSVEYLPLRREWAAFPACREALPAGPPWEGPRGRGGAQGEREGDQWTSSFVADGGRFGASRCPSFRGLRRANWDSKGVQAGQGSAEEQGAPRWPRYQ